MAYEFILCERVSLARKWMLRRVSGEREIMRRERAFMQDFLINIRRTA